VNKLFVQTPFVISVAPAAGVVQAELIVQQCALSYAMFLVCVEHTFEGVYRVPEAEFNRTAASLLGSSYLPMPWWWQWVTMGVEYHHFHHVNPRMPCYRMKVREGSLMGLVCAHHGCQHLPMHTHSPCCWQWKTVFGWLC